MDVAGAVVGLAGAALRVAAAADGGYAAAGVLSLCAALAFGVPWLGAALLVLAAFGTETIDGAGNLLFLRAVHPYERSEMTTVFVSFRDVAQLGPPAVCSVLLSVFALPSVFVAGGAMMMGRRCCRGIFRGGCDSLQVRSTALPNEISLFSRRRSTSYDERNTGVPIAADPGPTPFRRGVAEPGRDRRGPNPADTSVAGSGTPVTKPIVFPARLA